MLPALLLLVSAIVVAISGPRVLGRIDVARRDPSLLLVAWLAAILGVIATTVCSTVVLFLPEHGLTLASKIIFSHRTWKALGHGASHGVECLVGGSMAILLASGAAWIGFRILRATNRRVRAADKHADLLRVVARTESAMPDVLRLDHEQPVAFSLSGRREFIVATEGVFRLGDAAAAAVIAHERAHLRGRHHALLTWVQTLGAALPFVPLFRGAPAAIAELVELSADSVAARACGPEAVRSALLHMAMRCPPTGALAMADQAIEHRLARLAANPGRNSSLLWRLALRATAAAVAISAPLHLTITMLHLVVLA
ncbi:M56 family metallopeptidase [Nocardia nepalensis]|uniref:M56 family metallopeptidase n=1 Tax=Nocardia nepalensis TaxID=3375448 RepID=UPI003B6746B5